MFPATATQFYTFKKNFFKHDTILQTTTLDWIVDKPWCPWISRRLAKAVCSHVHFENCFSQFCLIISVVYSSHTQPCILTAARQLLLAAAGISGIFTIFYYSFFGRSQDTYIDCLLKPRRANLQNNSPKPLAAGLPTCQSV